MQNKIGAYFKNITPQKLVITVVVTVIAFFVLRKLWQLIKPSNYGQASYIVGGGTIPAGWQPTETTDKLYRAIVGWSFSPEDLDNACKDLVTLSDNQIIAVSNDWSARYGEQRGCTLLECIQSEWGWVLIIPGFGGYDFISMAEFKLENLGL